MSLQRDGRRQRRREIRSQVSSADKRMGEPGHNDDDDIQATKTMGCSFADLPEELWFTIHSLMPMREAARAACLSRAFLRSWRRRPILILSSDMFDMNESMSGGKFSRQVDHILTKHDGIGVKIFKLEYPGIWLVDASCNLKSWLQVAVKPGIEELTLMLYKTERVYKFPCSLLSDGVGSSLRHLNLRFCALHPAAELGPLRNLTSLQLSFVSITGDELEGIFYNSLALEHLDISKCNEIICLKIPCVLKQFSSLHVLPCQRLTMIDSKAPNLSSFRYILCDAKFSLGDALQMKKLDICRNTSVYYARTVLPSYMPNLVTLLIGSFHEVANTPMLSTKFLYLKHLTINLVFGSTNFHSYDYFSLVSFLDASPSLETFTLKVKKRVMEHEYTFLNPLDLRQMPEQRHDHLKSVTIHGFSSEKSLVELTCYILKNAVSLECITLGTIYGHQECDHKNYNIEDSLLMEAPGALSAIRRYIEDKVPPSVKVTVLEPCRQCHIIRGVKL